MEKLVYNYLLRAYDTRRCFGRYSFEQCLERLCLFESMIKNWHLRTNLVSVNDVENLWKKHFAVSLKPVELDLIPPNSSCLDAGSGAGFPGIPIKIFRPDVSLHLCESKRMKALFLQSVVDNLSLEMSEVIHKKAEAINERYDVILSRGMGKPGKVFPILNKLVKEKGKIIIWTSKSSSSDFRDCNYESYDIQYGGRLLVFFPALD